MYAEQLLDGLADLLIRLPQDGTPEWRRREAAQIAFGTLMNLVDSTYDVTDIRAIWAGIWEDAPPDAVYERVQQDQPP